MKEALLEGAGSGKRCVGSEHSQDEPQAAAGQDSGVVPFSGLANKSKSSLVQRIFLVVYSGTGGKEPSCQGKVGKKELLLLFDEQLLPCRWRKAVAQETGFEEGEG
ncbi:hypothetical protein CapIbe_007941 [Capra ibex]